MSERDPGSAVQAMPSSVAELQALLAAERAAAGQRISELEKERDNLHASHERLRQELELFKRRLFIAKAERVDTKQLEMEFAEKLRELDAVAGTLGIAADGAEQADAEDDAKARRQKARQAQEQSRHGPARPS